MQRARHIDPQASSARDQLVGLLDGVSAANTARRVSCHEAAAHQSDSFVGGGVQGGRGPEGI